MLAVLMSMKPEWWEKILGGEKTLEIRKTHPQNERLEWPVTVLLLVALLITLTGAIRGRGPVAFSGLYSVREPDII